MNYKQQDILENACKIEKVITEKIICIEVIKGDGTNENPVRRSKIYYTITGSFIGEIFK